MHGVRAGAGITLAMTTKAYEMFSNRLSGRIVWGRDCWRGTCARPEDARCVRAVMAAPRSACEPRAAERVQPTSGVIRQALRPKVALLAVSVILLAVLAGEGGYWLRVWRERATGSPTRVHVPRLDEVIDVPSFSEAENARAALRASAVCFAGEVMARHHILPIDRARAGPGSRTAGAPDLVGAIRELEHGREQFQGAEWGESFLAERTLELLGAAEMHDRWLDLYLQTVYRHPGEDLVAHKAFRALRVARQIGRETELLQAWRLVASTPFDSRAKAAIRAVSGAFPSAMVGELLTSGGTPEAGQ